MSKASKDELVLGAPPRADLLPVELKAEAKSRAQRRWLIMLVVVSIVVVGAVYAYSVIAATAATLRLASANERTATLLAEQAQYADARNLAEQIDLTIQARQVGVSTEIDWKNYLQLVQASLPPGTTIETVSASIPTLGESVDEPVSPLGSASNAELVFAATTPTLPDVSSWIDQLSTLPGFLDATPSAITLNEGGTYSVSISMRIDATALSGRFTETEESE